MAEPRERIRERQADRVGARRPTSRPLAAMIVKAIAA
jgi:hypothetical protein